jgi:hypothetical protein
LTPDEAVDRALETGTLDRSLPFLKKIAVQALSDPYSTADEAARGVRQTVLEFYREQFEGTVLVRQETLNAAIEELVSIYRRNVFPELGIDWDTYPDNIGHRTSDGCFRCHDGKHVSPAGQVLASDCDLCHIFVEKARDSESLLQVPADASFLHPYKDPAHGEIECMNCHTGAASPYSECRSCHDSAVNGHAMRFECSICHEPGGPTVSSRACSACHPTVDSPMHAVSQHADCLGCHTPHSWAVDERVSWIQCHETLGTESWEEHHPGESCSPCHDFQSMGRHMNGLPVFNGD